MKKKNSIIGILIIIIISFLVWMVYSNIQDIKRGWHDGYNAAQKGK